MHHYYGNVNFGLYWGLWDYICGTRFGGKNVNDRGRQLQRSQFMDIYTFDQFLTLLATEKQQVEDSAVSPSEVNVPPRPRAKKQ